MLTMIVVVVIWTLHQYNAIWYSRRKRLPIFLDTFFWILIWRAFILWMIYHLKWDNETETNEIKYKLPQIRNTVFPGWSSSLAEKLKKFIASRQYPIYTYGQI